jgi:hypothetical protein
MTWFDQLTGFPETSATRVRQHLSIDGETLTSAVNGKSWSYGRLETPSLAELRERIVVGATLRVLIVKTSFTFCYQHILYTFC